MVAEAEGVHVEPASWVVLAEGREQASWDLMGAGVNQVLEAG